MMVVASRHGGDKMFPTNTGLRAVVCGERTSMAAPVEPSGVSGSPGFDPSRDIRGLREPTVNLVGRQFVNDTEVAAKHLTEVCCPTPPRPKSL
jgi:hypothetical protein